MSDLNPNWSAANITDPTYRQAANRVRSSFATAGGAAAAAHHLESLLNHGRDTSGPVHDSENWS